MPEKLKVLFLPHPVREDMFYPWGVDVVNAVRATGNDIEVCDYKAELAPQFAGVDVVIDVGGSAGTEEMADLGAGQVRLWQILGTGWTTSRWTSGARAASRSRTAPGSSAR